MSKLSKKAKGADRRSHAVYAVVNDPQYLMEKVSEEKNVATYAHDATTNHSLAKHFLAPLVDSPILQGQPPRQGKGSPPRHRRPFLCNGGLEDHSRSQGRHVQVRITRMIRVTRFVYKRRPQYRLVALLRRSCVAIASLSPPSHWSSQSPRSSQRRKRQHLEASSQEVGRQGHD